MILDVANGDQFILLFDNLRGEFVAEVASEYEPIKLRNLANEESVEVQRIEFALAQARGDITRTTRDGKELALMDAKDILGFHKPEGSKVTLKELTDWQTQNEKIVRAATLIFYIKRFRKERPGTGHLRMLAWIDSHYPDAKAAGYGEWKPSPSSVTRAWKKAPHALLAALIAQTGKHKNRAKWPKWVYDLGDRMVRRYWTNEERHIIDAVEWFDGKFFPLRKERNDVDGADIAPPTHGTLANWINAARSHATVSLKFGMHTAHRQLGGRGISQIALMPLEWVVIDHTVSDIWVVILSDQPDEHGNYRILSIKRPWMVTAIDLYSRINLGTFFSFDPPSVQTVMECLRRVITPKSQLIERFGDQKGATDGFGFPMGLIFDNALENVMVSMQMALEGLGVAVEYAPRATPEYKSWVERYISTMNDMVRHLPGGIPLEISDTDPDPRDFASLTLADLTRLTDHRMVTRYHLHVHEGIGMPPARKWKLGLQEFGRGTVDDARSMQALMGRYKKAALTAEGIRLEGHVFHDPQITSELMDHMARFQQARKQRRGKDQTRTVEVHTFRNPANCSHISVVDLHTRQIVFLPNRDEVLASRPVSFAWAKAARKANDEANEGFHSREDRAEANRNYQIELENLLISQNHGDGKRTARLLEGGRASMQSPFIVDIEESVVSSSISGMKGGDIPKQAAFVERDGEWQPPKGRTPRRKAGNAVVSKSTDESKGSPKTIDGVAARVDVSNAVPTSFKPAIDVEVSEARLNQLERLLQVDLGEAQ